MTQERTVFLSLLIALAACLAVLGAASAQAQTSEITPLALGEIKPASIDLSAPHAQFSLLAPSPQTVTVQVLATTPGLLPTFRVIGQSGVVIHTATNSASQNILQATVSLPTAGQYIVDVQALNNTSGDFVITLQAGPPQPAPVALVVGQAVEATASVQASAQIYTFSAQAQGNLVLDVIAIVPSPAPAVILSDGLTGEVVGISGPLLGGASFRIPGGQQTYRLDVMHSGSPAQEPYTVCLYFEGDSVCGAPGAPTATPFATATLIATTPPQTIACTVVAGGISVNVRSGPGTNYSIISALAAGNSAAVIGRSADGFWWQINLNGLIGWISAGFVSAQGDCAGIPVVAAPPPPVQQPTATYTLAATPTFTYTPTTGPTATPTNTPTWTPTPTPTNTSGPIVITLRPGVLTLIAPGNIEIGPINPGDPIGP